MSIKKVLMERSVYGPNGHQLNCGSSIKLKESLFYVAVPTTAAVAASFDLLWS
jgi:hypothetical protein